MQVFMVKKIIYSLEKVENRYIIIKMKGQDAVKFCEVFLYFRDLSV